MCTVTYFPQKEESYILTQNRDEAPGRSTGEISTRVINGQTVIFPRDAGANGSWIAVSEQGQAACLLNGAFDRHIRKPTYRMSRGLLLLDLFNYKNADSFTSEVHLQDIEPFTMIIIEHTAVTELIWDGSKRYIRLSPSEEIRIWASATLYCETWRNKRKEWLETWIAKNGSSSESILDFHHFGGVGDPENDLVMNRQNKVRTVSITQLQKIENKVTISLYDLIHEDRVQSHLQLNPSF